LGRLRKSAYESPEKAAPMPRIIRFAVVDAHGRLGAIRIC
jgi:hypothetical protein